MKNAQSSKQNEEHASTSAGALSSLLAKAMEAANTPPIRDGGGITSDHNSGESPSEVQKSGRSTGPIAKPRAEVGMHTAPALRKRKRASNRSGVQSSRRRKL